jgi:hypothetical protein
VLAFIPVFTITANFIMSVTHISKHPRGHSIKLSRLCFAWQRKLPWRVPNKILTRSISKLKRKKEKEKLLFPTMNSVTYNAPNFVPCSTCRS